MRAKVEIIDASMNALDSTRAKQSFIFVINELGCIDDSSEFKWLHNQDSLTLK